MMNQQSVFENTVIVSDMDGTFLGASGSIVPENLEAIRHFTDNGGVFTLATGRCIRALEMIFPDVASFVNGPAILCGGAYLFDFKSRRVIDPLPLDQDKLIALLQKITSIVPDAGYRVSFERGFLCPEMTPFLSKNLASMQNLICAEKLEDHRHEEWFKTVFCAPEETIQKIRIVLNSFDLSGFAVTTSSPRLLEILNSGATKGQKIEKLRSLYPAGSRIVCVGDYENDLDMLACCDLAACPENACEKVKEIASVQLCDHRKGCIADLIYKLEKTYQKNY